MKLVGIMPVRNEDWILGLSARVALKWCDVLIMGLHNCIDQSEEIADHLMMDEKHDRVISVNLPPGPWDEMRHRQILLEMARHQGATHIAIVDADEVLTANLWGSVRNMIPQSPGIILSLPGFNLRGSRSLYHDNGVWGKRWFSLAFQDEPRLRWSGDKFHSREPIGRELHLVQPVTQETGGILHFWGASVRRLLAKHALYKMTERLRWPEKRISDIDQMYSWAIRGDSGAYGTPATWTYSTAPPEWIAGFPFEHLHLDREPWQENECVALMKLYGPRTFAGLDLFGVV
jgi:hypothetical protein